MKNRLFFLLAISCSLMHIANSASFNEYDFDDDEDEVSGIVGFIKRHKILTGLATTAACASIVIYNNPTLWDKCVALATYADTLKNEVWQGLKSDDGNQQQGKDQALPVEKKEPNKTQVIPQDKPNVSKPETVKADDQDKKKRVKLDPIDSFKKKQQVYAEVDKLATTIRENATLKDEKDGLKPDNVGEAKISINSLRFNRRQVSAIKGKLPEAEQKLLKDIETEIEALIGEEEALYALSSAHDQALKVDLELSPHFKRIVKKCDKLRGRLKIVIGSEIVDRRSSENPVRGSDFVSLVIGAFLGMLTGWFK